MTSSQTEARAIAQTSLWVPAKPEHAKLGWTYDFEQTERISRSAYDSTGYDATMEVVEFVMAEADRRLATALAAKDARISELEHIANHWLAEHDKLRAQLAEARKALNAGEALSRQLHAVIDRLNGQAYSSTLSALNYFDAARRALEAQGGEDVL